MNCCEEFLNACRLGSLLAVQSYLDEGLSVDVQNSEGETALQIAAANGFIDIVSLLLDKGALIDHPNCYGWTPLMHAARHGHSATVAYLLKMK
ncbi:Ankyrin repeat domain-containing protein 17, partial [Stegodyphus mimosarum]